jgi:hypothetical protein
MLRTFFTVVNVLCELESNKAPHTTVTLRFGNEGDWRADRKWYQVRDVVIEYPGLPLHSIGSEYPDIDGPMRMLLDLDGSSTSKK